MTALFGFLEINKLIVTGQSGCGKQRGTLDYLVCFETFIRKTFFLKRSVLFPYFSSSKLVMILHGIMNDFHYFGIRGRLAYFISALLNGHQLRVWVGNTFSDPHEQEMGVPQATILSVTLFSIKIINIVESVCPGVECFLYVDDFYICYRSSTCIQ